MIIDGLVPGAFSYPRERGVKSSLGPPGRLHTSRAGGSLVEADGRPRVANVRGVLVTDHGLDTYYVISITMFSGRRVYK